MTDRLSQLDPVTRFMLEYLFLYPVMGAILLLFTVMILKTVWMMIREF